MKNNQDANYASTWNGCGGKQQATSAASTKERPNVKARGLEQPEPDGSHIRTPCVLNVDLALIPALSLPSLLLCKIGIFTACHSALKYINSCLFYC